MNDAGKFSVAVAIILDNEDRILLQKKDSGYKLGPNTWCTFGGRIKENEAPEETIRREIKEETGLQSEDYRIVAHWDYLFKGHLANVEYNMMHEVFVIRYKGNIGKIRLGEGAGFAFFEKNELNNLNLLNTTKEVLNEHFKGK